MQLRNDPKCTENYKTDGNISLRYNGVDWVLSLQKITMLFRGTNICINCTSSVCFATSFMQLRNDPKCTENYETDGNISLGYNGVDWLLSLQKLTMLFRGTNFCINCTSSICFATSFMELQNDPKCTQIL